MQQAVNSHMQKFLVKSKTVHVPIGLSGLTPAEIGILEKPILVRFQFPQRAATVGRLNDDR